MDDGDVCRSTSPLRCSPRVGRTKCGFDRSDQPVESSENVKKATPTRSIERPDSNLTSSDSLSNRAHHSPSPELDKTYSADSGPDRSGDLGTQDKPPAKVRQDEKFAASADRRWCDGGHKMPDAEVAQEVPLTAGGARSAICSESAGQAGSEIGRSPQQANLCSSAMTPDSCCAVHSDSRHEVPNPSNCQHNPVKSPSDPGEKSWKSGGTQSPGSIATSEAYPITEEQLSGEVHDIYAGVEMVEKKCIEFYKQYGTSRDHLPSEKWQALIGLSKTLLLWHHDFYLASQHPSASPEVHQMAEKLSMPTRMWRNGIVYLLDMMRCRLPDSREHMVTFAHLAYSMLTLLLESVPKFELIWIEYLGNLARFQMVAEEVVHERELWTGIARYWYNKAAARQPESGQIQFQLALLSQGDLLRQLFYYTSALMSNGPFPSARAGILGLSNAAFRGFKSNQQTFVTAFVGAQANFLARGASDQLTVLCEYLLSVIDKSVARMGAAFKLPAVFIMSCNFAAMFEYSHTGAVLSKELTKASISSQTLDEISKSAMERWTSSHLPSTPETETSEFSPRTTNLIFSSYFTFQTLSIILTRVADTNMLPAVHISLAFIWHLILIGDSMKYVEAAIPWRAITMSLNAKMLSNTSTQAAECVEFPTVDGRKHLPEDFYMAGKVWSQVYYPSDFFGDSPAEDDERFIELPSSNVLRVYRCLWLGGRIAAFKRWITYDPTLRKFSVTPYAAKLEEVSWRVNPFRTVSTTDSRETGPHKQDVPGTAVSERV